MNTFRNAAAVAAATGTPVLVVLAVPVVGLIGALIGSLATMATGITKNRNESAQVAIAGLEALVAAQQVTITRLETRVSQLEDQLLGQNGHA